MYVPKMYRVDDLEEIISFVKANPFGTLVCHDGTKPVATHIPFELELRDGKMVLLGHVAYANPQWRLFDEAHPVLVMFQGPHTYISPSWYSQLNVPTWNYTAVHMYGHITIIDGPRLKDALRQLVDRYESQPARGATYDTLPEDFLDREMKKIVGFEIEIESVDGKYKMSQNRNDVDYHNIVERLAETGDPNDSSVSELMRAMRAPTKDKEG